MTSMTENVKVGHALSDKAGHDATQEPCVVSPDQHFALILFKLEGMEKAIEKLNYSIMGNGKLGLLDRTLILEQDVKAMKEDKANESNKMQTVRMFFWGLIATAALGIAGYLGTKIVDHVISDDAPAAQVAPHKGP